MNDPTPDLTPDQESAVRRALADARHTDPIPEAVASRLDRVLGDLMDERAAADLEAHSVVSLEARRRRRHATRMLVAAAAVVAGGFGINAMVGNDVLSSSSSDESVLQGDRDGSAPAAQAPTETGAKATDGLGGVKSQPIVPSTTPPGDYGQTAGVPTLGLHFVRQDAVELASRSRAYATKVPCVVMYPGDRFVFVSYAGRRAILVIRAPLDDQQRFDLYYCPTSNRGGLIRSFTVPAR